jgi:hypothetical protein
MAEAKGSSGLIHVLSTEDIPTRPALRTQKWQVELENWIIKLEIYLRRIIGKFTASNILVTIINENPTPETPFIHELGLDKWYQISAGTSDTFYLSDSDWRGREIVAHMYTSVAGGENTDNWQGQDTFYNGATGPTTTSFGSGFQLHSGNWAGYGNADLILENGTGKLRLDVNVVAGADTLYLRVVVTGTVKKTAPDEILS